MFSIHDTGGEPNTWEIKHFADITGNEPFLMQISAELPELVDASVIFATESEALKRREELKESICAICIEGLMPAFEQLKSIRASVGATIPELNRKLLYENFTLALWRSYKGLMQPTAKMMDAEIGFLFQDDAKFEIGLASWNPRPPLVKQHVADFLRRQRTDWQCDLGDFRNYIEHKSPVAPKVIAAHYDPAYAEKLFEAVWRTISDFLTALITTHFKPGMSLAELPSEQQNPHRPRRFGFNVQDNRAATNSLPR